MTLFKGWPGFFKDSPSFLPRSSQGETRAPEKERNSLKYTAHSWKSIVLLQVGAASSTSSYSVPSPYITKDLGLSLLPAKQHPAERSSDFFSHQLKGMVEFSGLMYMWQQSVRSVTLLAHTKYPPIYPRKSSCSQWRKKLKAKWDEKRNWCWNRNQTAKPEFLVVTWKESYSMARRQGGFQRSVLFKSWAIFKFGLSSD